VAQLSAAWCHALSVIPASDNPPCRLPDSLLEFCLFPLQAALKRYYVCGLREVCKAIKGGKAVAVLLAPNIEQNEAEGGLNDSVQDIITACSASSVPVVFALSRKKMGEVYGFRKRMSAIALLDVSAVQDVMQTMLRLAEEGRRSWVAKNPERCVAAAAAAVAREAAVALGAAGPSRAGSTTAEVAPAAGLSVRVS
jgi:selenocysteine insertion sequence-binding protein 2